MLDDDAVIAESWQQLGAATRTAAAAATAGINRLLDDISPPDSSLLPRDWPRPQTDSSDADRTPNGRTTAGR